jgi:hypothetical protein
LISRMSLATLRNRIDTELTMLGGFDNVAGRPIKDQCIAEALRQFVRKYEPDDLTASLAVVAGTLTYSIPDAIARISRVFKEDGIRTNFSLDVYQRKITFPVSPTGSVNYTVYGTPNKISTNLVAIIAALDEDYEDVFWQYIRAICFKEANNDDWKTEYQAAELEANKMRQDRNKNTNSNDASMIFKDRQGRDVDDAYNIDNNPSSISDYGSLGDL